MSGRHTGEQHHHTVEGTDPQLYVEVHEPEADAGLRPVLLLHGFSSSTKLNWQDTGWLAALLEAGRRVITVDLPGHGRSGAPEDMDSYSPSRIRADLLQVAFDAGVRPLRDGDPASGLDVIGYSRVPGLPGNSAPPSRNLFTGWCWAAPTSRTRWLPLTWLPRSATWLTAHPSRTSPRLPC
jgi:hypothetical protein